MWNTNGRAASILFLILTRNFFISTAENTETPAWSRLSWMFVAMRLVNWWSRAQVERSQESCDALFEEAELLSALTPTSASNLRSSDHAVREMRRLLLLLLGFAVQCGQKEKIIERIQSMDESAQKGIVDCIREVSSREASLRVEDIFWCTYVVCTCSV